MYIGIGPESKKRVLEEDAFSYACDRIYSGTEEEQDVAMQIFREAEMPTGSIAGPSQISSKWDRE